jgi:hypothetical protein
LSPWRSVTKFQPALRVGLRCDGLNFGVCFLCVAFSYRNRIDHVKGVRMTWYGYASIMSAPSLWARMRAYFLGNAASKAVQAFMELKEVRGCHRTPRNDGGACF